MLHILFLDFDGVLSPGNTGTLRYSGDLAKLLEPYPRVRIVLTTNWRAREDLSGLKDWLPPALAERVIDVAPLLAGGDDVGGREREVRAWLARNPADAWLALDDVATLFRPDCPWLFLTRPGDALDDSTRTRLTHRLKQVFG